MVASDKSAPWDQHSSRRTTWVIWPQFCPELCTQNARLRVGLEWWHVISQHLGISTFRVELKTSEWPLVSSLNDNWVPFRERLRGFTPKKGSLGSIKFKINYNNNRPISVTARTDLGWSIYVPYARLGRGLRGQD